MAKNVTKTEATKVLNAVKAQCKSAIMAGSDGPKLVQDWAWLQSSEPARWSVVWEEGPYQWAYLFPYGGIDEEFGFKVKDVSERVPDSVFAEAITSWAIGLYPS